MIWQSKGVETWVNKKTLVEKSFFLQEAYEHEHPLPQGGSHMLQRIYNIRIKKLDELAAVAVEPYCKLVKPNC